MWLLNLGVAREGGVLLRACTGKTFQMHTCLTVTIMHTVPRHAAH